MSKIGRQFNPALFQQARQEGTSKSGKGSSSSKSEGSKDTEKSEGSSELGGGPEGLPSVGLGGPVEQADSVEKWMGGSGAAYADGAADQHNEIGTKAARGQLIGQQQGGPNQAGLQREVDTLRARLAKLEGKIQANAAQETTAAQGVNRVAGGARQVGRSFGTASQTKTPVQAQNVEAIGQKQGAALDDDLPRVGLK